eukprot:gene25622-23227_t
MREQKRPGAQLPSNCARSATPSTTAAGCTGDGKPASEDCSSDCGGKAASGRPLRPPAWSSGFGVACFAAAFFAASLPAASAAALDMAAAAADQGSSSTAAVVAGLVAAVAVISAALFGCLSGGATKEAKIQELEATIKSLESGGATKEAKIQELEATIKSLERDNGTLRAALAAKSQGDVVLQLLEEVAAY